MAIQDDYIRITLRVPSRLHSQLAESAESTSKSMNAEIVGRLEATYAIDEVFAEQGIGTYRDVTTFFPALLRENAALAEDKAQFKALITETVTKLLDERLGLLESRLLSLPGSSFGKTLSKSST